MAIILNKDGTLFTGTDQLDPRKVGEMVDMGVWGLSDLAEVGLVVALPFEVPEGKMPVGDPRYVQSKSGWEQVYDVVDSPAPAEPTRDEKIADMLSGYGLTPEEFLAWVKS